MKSDVNDVIKQGITFSPPLETTLKLIIKSSHVDIILSEILKEITLLKMQFCGCHF